MPSPTHIPVAHVFGPEDFIGGDPVLDFINTVSGRDIGQGRDRLDSFSAVVDWAAGSGLLPATELGLLAALGRHSGAKNELRALTQLREALFELAAAVAATAPLPEPALAVLSRSWHQARRAQMLLAATGRIEVPPPSSGGMGLQTLRARLALAAVALLQNPPAGRLRLCNGTDCGWLFHDASKNGRRRWCSMATCGNTAKSRRHVEKARAYQDKPA